MEESSAEEEEEEETDREGDDGHDGAEQTFGEKAQALKVSEASKAPESEATGLREVSSAVVKAPAGSLTTVLTQALQTEDNSLLKSCLHSTDDEAILATIRRLNPSLAVALLKRLAERIARHPGRARPLGNWVKWIAVAHGGGT